MMEPTGEEIERTRRRARLELSAGAELDDTGEVRAQALLEERSHRLGQRKAGASATLPVLILRVAGERYGLALDEVDQVVPLEHLALLPDAPPVIAGVVNWRGEPTPVCDLAALLGLTTDAPTSSLVRLRGHTPRLCLLVDAVEGVVSRHPDAWREAARARPGGVVGGVTEETVCALDPEALRRELRQRGVQ